MQEKVALCRPPCRHGSVVLRALLSCRCGPRSETRLPWTAQIISDMVELQVFHWQKLAPLGHPSTAPHAWMALMTDFPAEWKEIVASFMEDGSGLDSKSKDTSGGNVCGVELKYKCFDCPSQPGFRSSKALLAHQRTKHGFRSPFGLVVGDVTRCCICGVDFHHRRNLLKHLSEKRVRSKKLRTPCGETFMQRFCIAPRTGEAPDEEVQRAITADRVQLRSARKLGHTHIMATLSVKRASRPDACVRPSKRLRSEMSPEVIV